MKLKGIHPVKSSVSFIFPRSAGPAGKGVLLPQLVLPDLLNPPANSNLKTANWYMQVAYFPTAIEVHCHRLAI